jgi:hypothetical protein
VRVGEGWNHGSEECHPVSGSFSNPYGRERSKDALGGRSPRSVHAQVESALNESHVPAFKKPVTHPVLASRPPPLPPS